MPEPSQTDQQKPSLQDLLRVMVERGGSDLHIAAGSPPRIRLNGKLGPVNLPQLTNIETRKMCYTILTDAQKHKFEEENELDFAFGMKGLSRFRGNMFVQRGAVGAVYRTIPIKIRDFDDLGLPPIVEELSRRPRGLVLVTGPTGSGKSSTLAAMIDKINRTRHEHIMTIEDPIEFLHNSQACLVNQREVGADTQSFKKALKYVLRQDPDVVMLGELRDMETIEAALTIAETGHLCFATLHTNSCVQTMNRIIDVFPANQQPQIRAQLSFVLEGVLSQILAIKPDGKGRILCMEIMVPNAAIKSNIRDDKVHLIYGSMQMGQAKSGMQTMNQSLMAHFSRRSITLEEALGRSSDPEELRQLMISSGAMRGTKPATR